MKESFWRGHPIIWIPPIKEGPVYDENGKLDPDVEGKWVFEDTKEPVPGYGGKLRPCVKCGKIFEGSNLGDADPCLGELPGVDNACCGHGVKELSYIRFVNGTVIKRFGVEHAQTKEMVSKENL